MWVAACNDTQKAEPTLKTSIDILTISTHAEFLSLQNDLVKMSKDQFSTWEKSKGFVALRTVLDQKGKRKWVTYRRIHAIRPMEYLSLDIKYVWVGAKDAGITCF